MLKEEKKNRIIILTTHYMDEADILGDRIGIMKGGKVVALGSPIFLKSTFGAGYNLIMVKSSAEPNTQIMPFLQQHLTNGADLNDSGVKKQSEIQQEMSVIIPSRCAQSFPNFFKEFDANLAGLGIQSYGITLSTLEEVFLKVGNLDDKKAPGLD